MLVIPGQRVGQLPVNAGPGTYIRGQHVHSSLVGHAVKYTDGEGKSCVKVARGLFLPIRLLKQFCCCCIQRR